MSYPVLRIAHPLNPGMFVEVILASRDAKTGRKVYTIHFRYPRFIHGEMMTHRVFNRNARSSRAVPVATMLSEIRNDPVVPWHWTRNQRGMQGVAGHDTKVQMLGSAAQFVDADQPVDNVSAWLHARDMACDAAESFANAEYHKQVVNRLVEPFMWMDLLVTSTHWENFLHLRNHPDAEPHIRDLAVLLGQALEQAELNDIHSGEWHMPYITEKDWELAYDHLAGGTPLRTGPAYGHVIQVLLQVSAARCARISYQPFDGNGSFERELERYGLLVGNDAIHASPLEHQCTPDLLVLTEITQFDENGEVHSEWSGDRYEHPELHGPLTGFIQFRKTVPGEAIHD